MDHFFKSGTMPQISIRTANSGIMHFDNDRQCVFRILFFIQNRLGKIKQPKPLKFIPLWYNTFDKMPITINIPKPANCAECGMEAVNHRAERLNLLIEDLLSPINNAIGFLSRPLQSVIDTIINTAGPWAIGLAIKLGLGIAINNPDEHTTES